MSYSLLHTDQWLALLRIGLGLWWLESFRHKNKAAWLRRGAGIAWAGSVAEKHRWSVVQVGFKRYVEPQAKAMAYLIVFGELAIGLGLTFGLLTPVAAFASLALNVTYFFLMIHDWAEQGQNSMMALIAVVVLGTHAWDHWSIGHWIGFF